MKALKVKHYLALALLTAGVFLAGALIGHNSATSMTDDEWRAQQARYDLLDREKLLQQRDDELSRHIYDLKLNIKAMVDALGASQSEQDRIRHELIIVQVKLLH